MSRSRSSLIAAILASALVIACSGDKPAETNTPESAGGAVRVSKISNLQLESLTIKAGTAVQWNNGDDVPHALVGDKNEFDSKGPIAGTGFRFTFDKPGVIAYHCTIHPSMTGKITVE